MRLLSLIPSPPKWGRGYPVLASARGLDAVGEGVVGAGSAGGDAAPIRRDSPSPTSTGAALRTAWSSYPLPLAGARGFKGYGCILILCALLTACSPTKLLTWNIPQDGFTRQDNIPYASGDRHSLDIYQAKQPLPGQPVIVFFYGGEWKFGAKEQYRFVAEPLANRGITVVVADYRIYPPTPFPGFIDDSATAVGWVHAHAAEFGGNPNNIFVMGHSAGAYNAVFLALDPEYLAKAGMQPEDLAGVIGISGPYNFLPITWPELKPIFEVVPDLNITQPITYADGKNPPLLLLAGAVDTTVDPIKNTETLYKTVLAKGGPATEKLYPDVAHIGAILAFAPTFAGKAPIVDDVVEFVKAKTRVRNF